MRIPKHLLTGFVLFSLIVLCGTLAAAQQTWWVQSADYGAGNRRQDVTQTVRRLVSGGNFTVNNQTMGSDPWKGADKTLRIVGKDQQGNVRDFRYGEGATVNSSQFRANQWGGGWNGGGNGQQTWSVQSADYGAGNRRQDVTNTVRRLVSGPNFTVNNQTMGGDPWKGADKTLRIQARDDRGNTREFKYGEGATVDSSMFRGQAWGGGASSNGFSIITAAWGSGSRMQNVTQRVQGFVRNNRLSMKVTPQTLGDPTPGVSKTLMVNYWWQGRIHTANRVEGEMLNLP